MYYFQVTGANEYARWDNHRFRLSCEPPPLFLGCAKVISVETMDDIFLACRNWRDRVKMIESGDFLEVRRQVFTLALMRNLLDVYGADYLHDLLNSERPEP